jgi:hypothetical protein
LNPQKAQSVNKFYREWLLSPEERKSDQGSSDWDSGYELAVKLAYLMMYRLLLDSEEAPMTRSLNGWQKLGVFISSVLALLVLSGCQKSDVDKCVEAQMEVFDEDLNKNPPKEDPVFTRKEWKADMYEHCLAISARGFNK